MSYILDALKKLENEKAKKKVTTGMVSISGELFNDEQRQVKGGSIGKIIALVVVAVALVTFGATWYFLKGGREPDRIQSRQSLPAPAVRYVAPTPPVPVTATSQVPAVQQNATPALKPPHLKTSQTVKKVKSAAKPGVSSVTGIKQGNLKKTRKRESTVPLAKEQPLQVETKLSTPPADIKISGIAWQEERNARRAVVNGFLTREGGMVSGAKVTEILRDRVRFTQDGKSFEIPFVASGDLTGPGK